MSRPRTLLIALLLAAFLAQAPTAPAGETVGEAKRHPAVEAWLEAWDSGNSDDLDAFLTEDTVLQEPTLSSDDLEGYRNLMRIGLSVLRNVEFTADELILEGDRGALTWSASAVHNESGKPVGVRGASIFHFRDGKIAREWRTYDRVPFLQQIGALPGGDSSN